MEQVWVRVKYPEELWTYCITMSRNMMMATCKINEETSVSETSRKLLYELSGCQHPKYDWRMWVIGVCGNGKLFTLGSD
jgi:hypothetical protein